MIDREYPMVVFTAHDRCDANSTGVNGVKSSCNSQAYTQAVRDDLPSELLFCLHHAKKFNDALELDGFTITHDIGAINRLVDKNYVSV